MDGLSIAYEVIGEGRPWILTPGGRFSKDYGGCASWQRRSGRAGQPGRHLGPPELRGVRGVLPRRVGVGDAGRRPGRACCASSTSGRRCIIGGSGGARVSMLAATRHRDVAAGLGVWWISGGVFGLLSLATYYCAPSVPAVWNGGMDAVADIPSWKEVFERNPREPRDPARAGPREFIATMERWMEAYCSCSGELIPGVPDDDAAGFDLPALVFRSGASDFNHPGRRPSGSRRCSGTPSWWSRPGPTPSGSTGPGACGRNSSAGRSSAPQLGGLGERDVDLTTLSSWRDRAH